MAKAFLISPETQTIEPIEIGASSELADLVGFPTLESDAVGDAGDRLFFDEECFIRGTSGRFRIDRLIPVAGKGVVVGVGEDGSTLRDVSLDIEDLRTRTRFE